MYAGIVEGLGRIMAIRRFDKRMQLVFQVLFPCDDLKLGDSISVNGVCLTVADINHEQIAVDIVDETLQKTNLGVLSKESVVNLERCLKVGDRIGGHFVSGHVDSTGEIIAINPVDGAYNLTIRLPQSLIKFIAPKGSVTIDGMSITVVNVFSDSFSVTLIPYTVEHTVANSYVVGARVNLEVDMLAKYLDQLHRGELS
ncbi:MAG: riboflavin synthase [Gammaproteobacteria bacterium]|nr:riboflavin synthase [Gammaproteobacteria bacterium]MCD8524484.1 riboflavin synthase [Gammaproteobacteria bacterium]MCD8542644.1 riboflavin synthase [Gammaproteobacteria bacterium]